VDRNPAWPGERPIVAPRSATCEVAIRWSGVAYPALLDPMFASTGNMGTARDSGVYGMLPSGRVLVAGGVTDTMPAASAEVFDPNRGTWAAPASMSTAREYHAGAPLSNGRVIVTGGDDGTNVLATAEIYSESGGTWTSAGSMANGAREAHAATTLANGDLLVA